ncbi:MAG: hypothetical protein ACE5JS_13075 [Nitrospinota bacterium]
MKRLGMGFLGVLIFAAVPFGATAQEEGKRPDEARRMVIEYRDGTRQTIQLDKDWWEILNILLPTTPAPTRRAPPPSTAKPPAEEAPRARKIPPRAEPPSKPVPLDLSGKWVNWRRGEKRVYTMSLIQVGKRVQGLHRLDPRYVIDGTLEGNILEGTWSSPEEVGQLIFEFSEDGRTFRGRWNTTSNLRDWKLGWNGRRQ